MWILKLGGSLLSSKHLPFWIGQRYLPERMPYVIVPGGGIFAKKIRTLQTRMHFHDRAAHRMALLAMAQYAEILLDRGIDLSPASSIRDIKKNQAHGTNSVWIPKLDVPVSNSWDISADSLSAWLSTKISARCLFLVKSVRLCQKEMAVSTAQKKGYLDRGFHQMVPGKTSCFWLHAEDHAHFFKAARTHCPSGISLTYTQKKS